MKKIILNTLLIFITLSTRAQTEENSEWKLSTIDMDGQYMGMAMANGRIGIMPSKFPLKSEWIMLNGVYEKEFQGGVSKVITGINFANLEVEIDGELVNGENIQKWKQTLDMKKACFTTSFEFKNKAKVTYTIYALHSLQYSGMMTVDIEAKKEVAFRVSNVMSIPSSYIEPYHSFHVLRDLETTMPIFQSGAKSQFGKHDLVTSSTFIFENERPELIHNKKDDYEHRLTFEGSISKGKNYRFSLVGSVCTSQDFEDPKSESERFTIYAMLEGKDKLLAAHNKAWERLWGNDIIIEGDIEAQREIRLSLFSLFSFARSGSGLSIPPMGLSSTGYNGHVFWDTELWMFPPILIFEPEIAESLLDYRFNLLGKAREKAKNFGFDGAMYPWESDNTGEEATPTWALTGTFEHHITADVGIAFWNYYRVTNDKQWLVEKGYPVLKEVANFWSSRVEKNQDGSYSIKNVVGADEFAHNVDDNAFTNGSAITVLKYAELAAAELDLLPNPIWSTIANNIVIHKFPDGTTMEHESYNGEIVKQADVNLLAFPLDIVSDKQTIIKDVNYYEPKIAKEGPAMSHAILSVLYSRLGNKSKAFELFEKSYKPNQRPPFGILAESATNDQVFFATGAGSMLQAVLFGFAGLELSDDGLKQNTPCLPEKWKSLTIKGMGVGNETIIIRQ